MIGKLRRFVLLIAVGLFVGQAALADEPPSGGKTGIVFEPAKDTGLSNLLVARREMLEKQKGAPLTGHEWWLWGLSAFDYDRDGDDDLLVCIHGSTRGAILRNLRRETGKLSFTDVTAELGIEGSLPSTDTYPLAWDFDGDGFLDIAGLLDDTSTACLWNRGGKKFERASFSLHPINGFDALADFNGDGFVDIRQKRGSKLYEFRYDSADATFKRHETDATTPANLPDAVRDELAALRAEPKNRFLKVRFLSHDLNDDGKQDLVVQAFGGYSGDRRGWYLLAVEDRLEDQTAALGLPSEGSPLLLADLDHDGDEDVLVASSFQGGLYLNDGKGGFHLTPGPLTDFVKQKCPYLQVIFREDLDNDGDLDLALSNRRYGREIVLENLGGGKFETVLKSTGWDADPLVLRDINDDGLLDVIIGGAEGKESIGVYLNKTKDAGRSVRIFPRMDAPNPYALGAQVELFPAGALANKHPRPLRIEQAHHDGSPIHLGLGKENTFDLRLTLPGQPPREFHKLSAAPKLQIDASGKVTPLP